MCLLRGASAASGEERCIVGLQSQPFPTLQRAPSSLPVPGLGPWVMGPDTRPPARQVTGHIPDKILGSQALRQADQGGGLALLIPGPAVRPVFTHWNTSTTAVMIYKYQDRGRFSSCLTKVGSGRGPWNSLKNPMTFEESVKPGDDRWPVFMCTQPEGMSCFSHTATEI